MRFKERQPSAGVTSTPTNGRTGRSLTSSPIKAVAATEMCKRYASGGGYARVVVTEKGELFKHEGQLFREWGFLFNFDLGMLGEEGNNCLQEYMNKSIEQEYSSPFKIASIGDLFWLEFLC